jgi:hypothetical protein
VSLQLCHFQEGVLGIDPATTILRHPLCGMQIVGRPKVGARPVHIYAVNATAKAWAHSDAEGVFFVISSSYNGNWSFSVKSVKVNILIPNSTVPIPLP